MTLADKHRERTEETSYPVMPGVGVVDAVRRHLAWALVPVVVLLVAAAALGAAQKPTYTATARLNIGRLDVSTQSIPGFALGVQSLAVAYARVVTADGVVLPVAEKLHLTPGQVRANISGSPVPQAPLILVEAKARTARGAVNLVNAVGDQLVTYLANVNLKNPDAERLLKAYKRQALTVNRAVASRERAQNAFDARGTAQNRDELDRRTAALQQDRLQLQALKGGYLQSQAGSNAASLVQLINPARHASSDRRSHLEALLFGALIAGLLIGISLAVYRGNQALHRALTDYR